MKYLVVGCLLLSMLVAGCGGNDKETQLPKQKKGPDQLIEKLRDPDPQIRLEALEYIPPGYISPKVIPVLEELLDDPDEEVRGAAADLLQKAEEIEEEPLPYPY